MKNKDPTTITLPLLFHHITHFIIFFMVIICTSISDPILMNFNAPIDQIFFIRKPIQLNQNQTKTNTIFFISQINNQYGYLDSVNGNSLTLYHFNGKNLVSIDKQNRVLSFVQN